jgi:hypothetical protein
MDPPPLAVAESGFEGLQALPGLSVPPPFTLYRLEAKGGVQRDPDGGVRLGPLSPERHRLELGPVVVLPGAHGLVDEAGQPLTATWLRRGAALDRFPYPLPHPTETAAPVAAETVDTLVFLPFVEFGHFGHMLTETAAWLGPLLDPGRDWLAATGDDAVLMVGAHAAPALEELQRLLPAAAPRRWRSSAALTAPLRARRALLPLPSMRNGHSIRPEHPRHLRLLLQRRLGPTVRLPPPSAGEADGSRLYLSRSRLAPPCRRVVGEEGLEQALRERGWTIAWPETQSLPEQLRQLRAASVIAGPHGSALHLLLYFGASIAGRTVISLYGPDVKLTTTYQLQACLQDLNWLVFGCLEPDPACPRQTNVERDKLLMAEPAELAELIDRLADQVSAPPRNRW